MKTYRIIPLLLLCGLIAGCSDKDDETPAGPYLPKSVRQIRITENDDVHVYDFRYDTKGRVTESIEAGTGSKGLLFVTTDYTYSINKVYVEQYGGGEARSYTLRRNPEGYAESLIEDGNTLATYLYNDNGYYYEKASDKGWAEYEYRMKGEHSNLDKITVYNASDALKIGEPVVTGVKASFEYEPGVPQRVNFDLSYFFISRHVESTLPLRLFNWLGKSSYLPSAIEWTLHPGTGAAEEELFEYVYTLDKENYITQITERLDGKLNATYEITYQ